MTSPLHPASIAAGPDTDPPSGVPSVGVPAQAYAGEAYAGQAYAGEAYAGQAYAYAYEMKPPGRVASFLHRLPDWAAPAGVAVLIAGGVAYTLLANPTSLDASSMPTCVMKLFTGFDCPGCGGTRAAWYMLHGDIPAAARHHAPLLFAAPFLAYLYGSWALGTITKRIKLPKFTLSNRALIGFLIAWLVFSVVRNLPWTPFTWLFV